ncbi:MAG: hypothetical protein M3132_00230 [Actinomycetia bacterium]|nr:hypothetical protein [Actinomycetes bacterium]
MSDEMNPEESSTPEPKPAEPTHAEAPATGPMDAAEYASALQEVGVGDAKKTLTWLGKMMPKAVSGGVKLPALTLLDPGKKSQYKDFLGKETWNEPRKLLKQRLGAWIRAIESADELDDIQEKASERNDQLAELINENLAGAFETIRPVEKAYRALDGFFANAQVEPGADVDAWFFNANSEQLMDSDDRDLFDSLATTIREEYKFFSLKNVYSNLVIPGWVGGIQELDRLGDLGEMYKMQVFTDVEDYETYDDMVDVIETGYEGIKGSTTNKQYVALVGNHLMSRERHGFEDDDLFVSPASHLAGLVFHCDETMGTHESSAGYVKGGIQGPLKDRFRLDRDKVSKMKQLGIIPTAHWDGKVRMLGDWNLSAKEGLDTYSRIRTEDWIVKNTCHYLNKQAFKNITNQTLSAIQKDLRKFLNECVGDTKPLDSAEVEVRATPEQRARHEVDVQMKLGFKQSVHTFNVKVREDDAGNTAVDFDQE